MLGNSSVAAMDAQDAQHQWAFVIDLRKCDGCEKCTKACQTTHSLAKDQKWINVYRITERPARRIPCHGCACTARTRRVCACVPVAATYKNAEGVVLVNQDMCIGCRTCMAACPYEARYFNWSEPPTRELTIRTRDAGVPGPAEEGHRREMHSVRAQHADGQIARVC